MCDAENSEARIVRDLLSRVGDKWSLLVIRMLHEHSMRFTELQRSIDGISHRMLTQTLRNLERDGLVSRTSYPEIPPRVEYAATDLGRSLALPVLGLVEWAAANHASITDAREAFDAARD
ncbi:transcriptional regulator [Agromyces aureus]|uniref:Transcriptional regulator n=1 Tax=Agromyces aureus TaxID=453304 RepID=A0A191WK21_9MICO|nr:transcriptional regulator [Agromyces aureus]